MEPFYKTVHKMVSDIRRFEGGPQNCIKTKIYRLYRKKVWLTVMNVLLFSHVINNVHGTKYVLVIPWFVRMYDAIMHERERVHYRTYMRRTMV